MTQSNSNNSDCANLNYLTSTNQVEMLDAVAAPWSYYSAQWPPRIGQSLANSQPLRLYIIRVKRQDREAMTCILNRSNGLIVVNVCSLTRYQNSKFASISDKDMISDRQCFRRVLDAALLSDRWPEAWTDQCGASILIFNKGNLIRSDVCASLAGGAQSGRWCGRIAHFQALNQPPKS